MGASTDELVDIVLGIDWDKEVECESVNHTEQPMHHGGAVTHVVRGRCPHLQGLRCSCWVQAVYTYGGCVCEGCGYHYYDITEITFIEL